MHKSINEFNFQGNVIYPEEYFNEGNTEGLILEEMDRLHLQQHQNDGIEIDEILQEDDGEEGENDCCEEAFIGFKEYLGPRNNGAADNGTIFQVNKPKTD